MLLKGAGFMSSGAFCPMAEQDAPYIICISVWGARLNPIFFLSFFFPVTDIPWADSLRHKAGQKDEV